MSQHVLRYEIIPHVNRIILEDRQMTYNISTSGNIANPNFGNSVFFSGDTLIQTNTAVVMVARLAVLVGRYESTYTYSGLSYVVPCIRTRYKRDE